MRKTKVFYGWYIVAACVLLSGASLGLLFNCFTAFIKPVTESMGFSRGGFTFITTIYSLIGMPMLLVYGELFRRFSPLRVMRVCTFLTPLTMLAYSFATELWHFYVVAALFGLVYQGAGALAISLIINNWFVAKKGMANGIAFAGSGVTTAVMVPFLGHVIADYGWRWGYRVLAAAIFLLFFIATWLILRDKPSDMGLLPYGVEAQGAADSAVVHERRGLMRSEAVRTPAFYLIAFAFFSNSFVNTGVQPHALAYFTDIGYSAALASAAVSFMMGFMSVTKVVLGVLFDKLGSVGSGLLAGVLVTGSGVLLLLAGLGEGMVWAFALWFSFAFSCMSVFMAYMLPEIFGTRDFSSIYSLISVATALSSAGASYSAGLIFDMTGSYTIAWALCAVLGVCSTVCMVIAARMGRTLKDR